MIPMLFIIAAVAALLAVAARASAPRWLWLAPVALGVAGLMASGGFVAVKALTRLAMPAGLLWLAGLAGVVVLLRQGRRVRWALGLWLAYTAAGNVWIGGALLARLEAPFIAAPASDGPFDAVLVLGGGTAVRPDGAPQLGPAGDRVRVGADLHRRGLAARLITCGTSVAGLDQAGARDLAAETRALWRAAGVPAGAIHSVSGPRNTREELVAFTGLARANGWRRLGLVSSAWHLRRATRLAAALGLEVAPVPADLRGAPFVPNAVGLIPSGNGFYRNQLVMKEYLGAAFGR